MEILVLAKRLGFTAHTEYIERDWSFPRAEYNEIKIIDLLYESN
jgi:hypothetical protein